MIMQSVGFCPLSTSYRVGCGVRFVSSIPTFVQNVHKKVRKRLHTFFFYTLASSCPMSYKNCFTMIISNLTYHESSANGGMQHYEADLKDENSSSIHVCISSEKGSNDKYVAFSSKFLYSIESVTSNGVEKDDISEWLDGDTILLGTAVPESNEN